MARTYKDFTVYRCEDFHYEVKVPTPAEFQARTELKDVYGNDVRIVITNFCYVSPISGKREKYGVAMFRRDPDAPAWMREKDLDWETTAKPRNVMSFEGKSARKDAVGYVGDLLKNF